jgi:hypothetical protein
MEWIVNTYDESFQNILFVYDELNWEITIDNGLSDRDINLLVMKRRDELTDEFIEKGTYEFSDLIVDWTKKNKENE